MCLAVPVKVIELLSESEARVELEGIQKIISIELTPEVNVGDYVIVHVGYALSVLDEEEAQTNLKVLNELP